MNKRFFKKNRNYASCSGFTLVEVLITVAIVAIIMGVIGTLFFSGATTYNEGSKRAFVQNDTRLAMEMIQNEVRYATELEIINPSEVDPETEDSYIYIQDGKIIFLNSINGLDDYTLPGLYKENVFSKVNDHLLQIDVSGIIHEPGDEEQEEVFTLSTVVNLLNIEENQNGIINVGEVENAKAIKFGYESLNSSVEAETPEGEERTVPPEYIDHVSGEKYSKDTVVMYNNKLYIAKKDTDKPPSNKGHWTPYPKP